MNDDGRIRDSGEAYARENSEDRAWKAELARKTADSYTSGILDAAKATCRSCREFGLPEINETGRIVHRVITNGGLIADRGCTSERIYEAMSDVPLPAVSFSNTKSRWEAGQKGHNNAEEVEHEADGQ